MFIGLEREEWREKEIERSIGCLQFMPRVGIEPATKIYALTSVKTVNFNLLGIWDHVPTN